MKKIIISLVFLLFPIYAFADQWYTVIVKNTLNVPITYDGYHDKECIQTLEIPDDFRVEPGDENQFRFEDDGDGATCGTRMKEITFHFKAELPEEEKIDSKIYDIEIDFDHEKQGSWKTKMFDNAPNVDRPMALTSAFCGGENCLDRWVRGSEPLEITIGLRDLAKDLFHIETLNLGNVSLTDGLGKLVPVEPLTGAKYIDITQPNPYRINFSRTTRECILRDNEFICPSSINYYTLGNGQAIMFACAQESSGDATCPWTLENSDGDTYVWELGGDGVW
ncbi:hypothetical protein L3V79_05110 [Thiotrichales bacterium 19S9-12]|nr:hypothetical protein [Thiotrichales bacterium 19S9-11]MCF6811737.1 hypothetical protein [Thiotrichales bacterium 19S9-12]